MEFAATGIGLEADVVNFERRASLPREKLQLRIFAVKVIESERTFGEFCGAVISSFPSCCETP